MVGRFEGDRGKEKMRQEFRFADIHFVNFVVFRRFLKKVISLQVTNS